MFAVCILFWWLALTGLSFFYIRSFVVDSFSPVPAKWLVIDDIIKKKGALSFVGMLLLLLLLLHSFVVARDDRTGGAWALCVHFPRRPRPATSLAFIIYSSIFLNIYSSFLLYVSSYSFSGIRRTFCINIKCNIFPFPDSFFSSPYSNLKNKYNC